MSESWLQLIFALGGGLGATARVALALLLPHRYPLSTLLVNVTGCLALGALLAVAVGPAGSSGPLEAELQRLVVGFCGGFTTFSSFAYQSLELHREHSLRHAAGNVLLNLVLCVAAFVLGSWTVGILR